MKGSKLTVQSDEEDTEDVEQEDTPENEFDDAWHITRWVLGLSRSDTEGFSTAIWYIL